jgi:hypothetical protein
MDGVACDRVRVSRRAWGGVVGPAVFVIAWVVLGRRQSGYSPVQDPISRLAAVDAPSRAAMTAAFLTFGAGVALYARELRSALPGGAALAAATTAAATVGIAAAPLGSSLGGAAHAACAGVAYVALALAPILGGRAFFRQGRTAAAGLSVVAGALCGGALVGSAISDRGIGLFQRTGLTVGDIWIVGTALWLVRRGPARAGHGGPRPSSGATSLSSGGSPTTV